jgi:hypothetical protein
MHANDSSLKSIPRNAVSEGIAAHLCRWPNVWLVPASRRRSACALKHRAATGAHYPSISTLSSRSLYQNYFLAAYYHCLSRPASHPQHYYPNHTFGVHQRCPAPLKSRATFNSGASPPSRLVVVLWAACLLAAWTRLVRWLFDTTIRKRQDSEEVFYCAGERGEPAEGFALTVESLHSCEEIPAHPYPLARCALATLHQRLHYGLLGL